MRTWMESLEPRALFAAGGAATAASENFLVSSPSIIEERTWDGELVRRIDLVADGDSVVGLAENHDVVVADGKLWIYDGDFAASEVARIRVLDLTTGQWQLIESDPPWTTGGNGINGNVGVVGDHVIFDAFDGRVGRDPVRSYNTKTGEFRRAGGNRDYQDLVVGLDGLVYSMEYGYSYFGDDVYGKLVHVHDPDTLEELRTVELISAGDRVTSLAVDAAGDIFAAGILAATVYHYDGAGNVLDTGSIYDLNTGVVDMDIAPDGRIVMGTRGYGKPLEGLAGEAAIITDASLDHFERLDFNFGSAADIFVAFGSLGDVDPTVTSIAGNAFDDVNFNGVRDAGEALLAGWQVFIDDNGDGIWQWWDDEPVATTSYTGRFAFHDLPKGDYTIRLLPAKGFVGTTRQSFRVSVPLLGTVIKRFGATRGGTVQGYVFNDIDANGARDAG